MNPKALAGLADYRRRVAAGEIPAPRRQAGKVTRVAVKPLDGFYGRERGKRLVLTYIPGTDSTDDIIELRPKGSRISERLAVQDIYRMAIQARVNSVKMAKLRDRKARRATSLANQRDRRAEARLTRPLEK